MKAIAALCLGLCLAPAAVRADGLGERLVDRGAQLMLRQLLDQMGPAVQDLGRQIDGISPYFLPEILPNGDVIIRRKVPLVPLRPGAPGNPVET